MAAFYFDQNLPGWISKLQIAWSFFEMQLSPAMYDDRRRGVQSWISDIKPAVACLSVLFACVAPAAAIQLVTEQEAAYPDDPYGSERGGPTPGPEVEIVSPALSGLIKSPFQLKIKFKAHGGAEIDRDSIAITYKKVPAVDITQRIRSAIRADGIDLTDAELPAGVHPFRIDLKDSRGRRSAPFFFKIA
jgi:hypothetical protein